ncbi:pyrimidine 5'-nucleotidase [Celeribacter baekdonensis]|jgi:putative hydrolase of the HAD superfamily|uniref:Pyrimidine 5'-nucleotidase n=1 Tax=Celeribacter baekdonensis TaxID=875171 RepID=A0A2R4M2R0_9RHOB|nr:pyrimidine 5'-nucleotidase [Celeribacter baekdonensis]AVW91500.1 pyrimidine 5'-nucleotidase [Celeribacter baekdonensis]|tara:strand:+ start:102887 stop:103540 length:654 start_codon:yes stop_codon:yes gene_type:complete
MVSDQFSHVNTWVFDLDNTLYPPEAALFAQIEVKMTDWVARELGVSLEAANALRSAYWRDYGTTLSGMMAKHGTDPLPYLSYVHDIDFSGLQLDAELKAAITALPGRKIVYTNGSAPYAERVLEARGLTGIFNAVYGIEHAKFHPKPLAEAFDTVLALDGITPNTAAMFEDDPRNLKVPHDLGMKTVYVAAAPLDPPAPHIHHHTDNLSAFLRALIG